VRRAGFVEDTAEAIVLSNLDPASAIWLLIFSLLLVMAFEATAWRVTLPVTILIAGGLYYLFESPIVR
jgi:hypothetical protein